MERFYFDINDGRTRRTDTEGTILETPEAARSMAVQELAYLIRDEMPDGAREAYVVTVRDEDRRAIYVAMATMLAESLE